jgi:hypothetical protein
VLLREVTVRDRDHTRDASKTGHHRDALCFVELVPQRMSGSAGPAYTQVSVARDLADYIGRDVETTRDHPSR